MTSKEATQYLGVSRPWLYKMARKGKLRRALDLSGDTVWLDEDIQRMRVLLDYGVADSWVWTQQYTVVYCRTEPVSDLPSAAQRLQAQRDRMVRFSQGRGLEPDMVIAEVRPVLRYGTMSANGANPVAPTGLQSLFGLILMHKVKTLIIETIDRLCAIDSWFLYETMLSLHGVDVIIANRVWPTAEQVAESKGWMADMLVRFKVLSGEIHNQSVIDTFMKGFDPKATFLAATKVEAKLTQREKEKKKPTWAKLPLEKRILDIDDCWTP